MSDALLFAMLVITPTLIVGTMVTAVLLYEREIARYHRLIADTRSAVLDYRSALERYHNTVAPSWEEAQEARADLVVAEQRLRRLVG